MTRAFRNAKSHPVAGDPVAGDAPPSAPTGAGARSSAWLWGAVVVVLLIVASLCLTVALRSDQWSSQSFTPPALPLVPGPGAGAGPTSKGAAPVQPSRARPVLQRSVPLTLRIPAIGVSVPLSELGLQPNGTVQVPSGIAEPGWYKLGPSPGQVGSAVILGHVDSYLGVGVFYELRTLRAGDAVDVGLADGVVARFVVRSVAIYLKTQFPAERVYGLRTGRALELVTCGGNFDFATGHYLSNIVVSTTFVSSSKAGRAV